MNDSFRGRLPRQLPRLDHGQGDALEIPPMIPERIALLEAVVAGAPLRLDLLPTHGPPSAFLLGDPPVTVRRGRIEPMIEAGLLRQPGISCVGQRYVPIRITSRGLDVLRGRAGRAS